MIRGTTAQFKYKLPCQASDIEIASIVFGQNGNSGPDRLRPLPIRKVLGQCKLGDCELIVTLNQEETLRFSDKIRGYTQARVIAKDGSSFACRKQLFIVYPVVDDSILDGDILPTPDSTDIIILDGSVIQ